MERVYCMHRKWSQHTVIYVTVVVWVIVRVCSVVLRRTVVGVDWRFDNLSGSHHQTLMMASAQVVETSVNTNNSPSQDYTTNPDDHSNHNIDSPGFKPFTVINICYTTCWKGGRSLRIFRKFLFVQYTLLRLVRETTESRQWFHIISSNKCNFWQLNDCRVEIRQKLIFLSHVANSRDWFESFEVYHG